MTIIFINTLAFLFFLVAPLDRVFEIENITRTKEYFKKESNIEDYLPIKSERLLSNIENPYSINEANKLGTLLWRANFETGDKTEFRPGGEFLTGPGKASSFVTTEKAKSGSKSLKMTVNSTNGVAGTRHYRWEDPDENKDLIYTAWFYNPQKIDFSGNFFSNIMQWKLRNVNGSSRVLWELGFGVRGGRGSGGDNFISLRRNLEHWGGTPGSNLNYKAIQNINVPVGKWFKLQIRYIHGHNNDGRMMIWQGDTEGNDVLIYDIKNVTTYPLVNGDGIKSERLRWSVNNYTKNTIPKTTHIFIDDISFHLPAEKNVTNTPIAPTIAISSPSLDASFQQGSNILITAKTFNYEETIAKVDFYRGNTFLGTDTTFPFNFGWENLPAGNFALTAKATDEKGSSIISAVVNINVVNDEVISVPNSGTELLRGLMAFYEMNTSSSGILKDSHGQNHGVTNQISHVNGFNDKGNMYDGKSSISSVPHNSSLNLTTEFTLMADIFRKGNGQESASIIMGKTFSAGWPENQVYSLAITRDNKIRIRTNTYQLKDWVSSQTVPFGKWVRIIATYKSGEGYSLYFNNIEPEKSGKISGTIVKSELELTLGSASLQKNAANLRRFEGVLDNVGIWNRQLSNVEITRLIKDKITYPDFKGNELYRITTTEEIPGKITAAFGSTIAKAGEKQVFWVEKYEDVVFDHWSVDGVQVSDQTIFEFEMPKKDIRLTKHFRTFVYPEITIVLPEKKSEPEVLSEVLIKVETKSNDINIEKVELFNGEDLIAEHTQQSFDYDWKNIPEGNHQLIVRITDSNGKYYFSEPAMLKFAGAQSKDIPNVLLDYVIGPNPTIDHLNVIFNNLDGIYDFEFSIISMNGVIQKTFNLSKGESIASIDVSGLNKGIYVLHIKANGHILSSRKFLKK